MSVSNITAGYPKQVQNPPTGTPLEVRNGLLRFTDSLAWCDFFRDLQAAANRYPVVAATVDFGTINAGNVQTESISFDLTPAIEDDAFINIHNPAAAGNLIFGARILSPNELFVIAYNWTGANLTPGPLDLEFYITPRQ